MPTNPPRQPGHGGPLAIAGAVLLMVLCCAGPALLAGGAISLLGAVLLSRWVIGAGALITVAAAAHIVARRAGTGTRGDDCCPGEPGTGDRRDPTDG